MPAKGLTPQRRRSDQSGVIVIIIAFCVVLLLGLLGLVVDLGYLYVTKAELQRAADAGAMAGAQALFPINFPSSWPQCSQAQTQAQAIARANLVNSAAPTVTPRTGRWDWHTESFSANCSSGASTFTNAVRVSASRSDVPLFFMGALGIGPISQLSATATAVMDFIGGVPAGAFPVAISTSTFASVGYGKKFQISFQTIDNGGWFVPQNYSPNSATLANFVNQTPPMQALNTGDLVNLNNGNTSALNDVYSQWQHNHGGNWFVVLPVVPTNKFSGSQTINGFVGATIVNVVNKKNQNYLEVTLSNAAEIPGTLPGGVNYHALTAVKLVN